MIPRTDETVATMLSAQGQRYTPKRRAIVAVLADADNPLTIGDILARSGEADAPLPQSSVYRNLSVLESAGVVRRVVATDEFSRYELGESLTGHHHHLLCTGCGQVEDFELTLEVEAILDESLDAVAVAKGFAVAQHRLDLVGLCETCTSTLSNDEARTTS